MSERPETKSALQLPTAGAVLTEVPMEEQAQFEAWAKIGESKEPPCILDYDADKCDAAASTRESEPSWRNKCADLLDIFDDSSREVRHYVPGALRETFEEVRALLAAPAAPASEPLEIERLKSALAEANQSCTAEHVARELAHDELQRRVEAEREDGSRWFWQGDGHDHLESMIDGMQVIIGAAQLRALLAAPAPAAQAAASTQQSDPSAAQDRHPMPIIREKLARFEECAEDGQDVDIGRGWFDALTFLGLLARVQRSPARWEMTAAGEAILSATSTVSAAAQCHVPEGWKLVPVEPTQEMMGAGIDAAVSLGGSEPWFPACYQATLAAAPTPPSTSTDSAAARDVLAERRRQIEAKGWTPEHDDEHSRGELAMAASCYAIAGPRDLAPAMWPWAIEWWKPGMPRRNLVKAGALILAELERRDRAALAEHREGGA